MKPIEHVLLHPLCVLSHLMCACKFADEFITSKNIDLTRFF